MGTKSNLLKKETVTRAWHGVDVGLALYSLKKDRSFFNYVRVGFAVVGLLGNIVIAHNEGKDNG